MMYWRVREYSRGGCVAEYGGEIESGTASPTGIGFLMPAFVVSKSIRFDTRRQAEAYIRKEERSVRA